MKKHGIILLIFWLFIACADGHKTDFGTDINQDTAIIKAGKELFSQNCASCHNFKNYGIGPNLNGITHVVNSSWLRKFIKNNQDLLNKGDERALKVSEEFAGTMPNFDFLTSKEIEAILAYMHTFNSRAKNKARLEKALKDPITQSMEISNIKAEIEFLATAPKTSENEPYARINKIGCEPTSGRIFINDLRGFLYEIENDSLIKVLSIKELEPEFINEPGLATGFGSFAFHPDFENNALLYTTHSEPKESKPADFTFADSITKGLQWVLKERKIRMDKTSFSVISEKELLRVDFAGTIHGMQEIAFNPTAKKGSKDYGKLYIGMGDGSSVEKGFKEVAIKHDAGVWSSILRIDPLGINSTNGKYGIPMDNPFFNEKGYAKEVWAYGFRNPNKLAWDSNGKLYTGDIGHNQIEELNHVRPGKFYGWPFREGTFVLYPDEAMDKIYPLPKTDSLLEVTYPIIQYDHSEGAAISGGYFSRDGYYICGDIPTGHTWIANISEANIKKLPVLLNGKPIDFKKVTGSDRVDLRFGQDCEGKIYLFTKADGKIYKMEEFILD